MSEDTEDILNVVQRWEALGLLDGLPIQERVELAQIYDNATRLLLADLTLKRVPRKVSDVMDELFIPICRRLYKRVGPNFDLELMMSKLLDVVTEQVDEIFKSNIDEPEKNPVIDFCVDFADSYEDGLTNKNVLTKEQYEDRINDLLSKLKDIMLNDNIVSYVNKKDNELELNISKVKKTTQQTRFWNQSVAKQLFNSVIDEINKGL
jgi:hypothetical protein